MKTNHISFAEVLRNKTKTPPLEKSHQLRLHQLLQRFEVYPDEEYTLAYGKVSRQKTRLFNSKLEKEQEEFDSWIHRQSFVNKENVMDQPTRPVGQRNLQRDYSDQKIRGIEGNLKAPPLLYSRGTSQANLKQSQNKEERSNLTMQPSQSKKEIKGLPTHNFATTLKNQKQTAEVRSKPKLELVLDEEKRLEKPNQLKQDQPKRTEMKVQAVELKKPSIDTLEEYKTQTKETIYEQIEQIAKRIIQQKMAVPEQQEDQLLIEEDKDNLQIFSTDKAKTIIPEADPEYQRKRNDAKNVISECFKMMNSKAKSFVPEPKFHVPEMSHPQQQPYRSQYGNHPQETYRPEEYQQTEYHQNEDYSSNPSVGYSFAMKAPEEQFYRPVAMNIEQVESEVCSNMNDFEQQDSLARFVDNPDIRISGMQIHCAQSVHYQPESTEQRIRIANVPSEFDLNQIKKQHEAKEAEIDKAYEEKIKSIEESFSQTILAKQASREENLSNNLPTTTTVPTSPEIITVSTPIPVPSVGWVPPVEKYIDEVSPRLTNISAVSIPDNNLAEQKPNNYVFREEETRCLKQISQTFDYTEKFQIQTRTAGQEIENIFFDKKQSVKELDPMYFPAQQASKAQSPVEVSNKMTPPSENEKQAENEHEMSFTTKVLAFAGALDSKPLLSAVSKNPNPFENKENVAVKDTPISKLNQMKESPLDFTNCTIKEPLSELSQNPVKLEPAVFNPYTEKFVKPIQTKIGPTVEVREIRPMTAIQMQGINAVSSTLKTEYVSTYNQQSSTPSSTPSFTPSYTPGYTPIYTPSYTPNYTPSYTQNYTQITSNKVENSQEQPRRQTNYEIKFQKIEPLVKYSKAFAAKVSTTPQIPKSEPVIPKRVAEEVESDFKFDLDF